MRPGTRGRGDYAQSYTHDNRTPMTLAADLAAVVDQARARGGSMIDCHTLEQLLARHEHRRLCECARPDLLADGQNLRPVCSS